MLIVQENRSFDNLFGTFPGVHGATSGYFLKKVGGKYVRTAVTLKKVALAGGLDINHNSVAYNYACDGQNTYPKTACDMDGFNLEGINGQNPAGTYPYQYIDPADIKPYWDLAKQYAIADDLFQTQGSGSFTAHQDLVAGGTALDPTDSLIDYPSNFTNWGCNAAKGTKTTLLTTAGQYRPDKGPFPCLTYPTSTLRDLLDAKGVSWKYYTPPYKSSTQGALWNAFAAIKAVYDGPEWNTNVIIPETTIFTDLQNGGLPALSWVIPSQDNSDHPGGPQSPDNGPEWVASVVNAIGKSDYWKSTAIVILWDDWGGYYDHVPPAFFDDAGGLGFRVPLVVVSPYTPKGRIVHAQYEFGSIMKFVEQTFALGSMGTTDVRATAIGGMFDFKQKPRRYVAIPSKLPIRHFMNERPSYKPVDRE
ncbi:MAG TPA: alkaline phosphatase family protein [Candidatus Tumulicola sp.]